MTMQPRDVVADFVRAVNTHDAAAFITLFADNALVKDAGKEHRGIAEIKSWSESEIFEPRVTLEVLGVSDGDDETMITAIVDGTFDKTGLPDPLILEHHIAYDGDKIVRFTSRLAEEKPET